MEPADQVTTTWEATAWDRVTVKSAVSPSATTNLPASVARPVGRVMPTVAVSSSVIVMVAGVTSSPAAAPCSRMVSSPSTTWSSAGVTVKLAVPLDWPDVMVMSPSVVAV